ncbi:MAG TPA: CBS domain-containing protein [Candidatus Bathyarchaeia archaeon]|nr:CBS domain-containing protein [Candidatus Bathyarchaeia archaeon]
MSEQKTVRDIMTKNIVSIEQNKTALEAARLMTESSISSLIVHADDESAIGILTERDFLSKVCSKDLQASKVKIVDIMSSIQMSAQPNTPLEVAVQRMINNKIRRLPVMESGKVVGIITVTDMAKALRKTLLIDGVLSALSEV